MNKYKNIIGIFLATIFYVNAINAEIVQTSVSIGVNIPKSVSQNSAANVTVDSYDIAPYGEAIDINTSIPFKSTKLLNIDTNPFIYGQAYFDNESGVNYMKARYQNPRLMRFISQDSEDLTNRYAYGNGDPINNFDPTGHFAEGLNYVLNITAVVFGLASIFFTAGTTLGIFSGALSTIQGGAGLASQVESQQNNGDVANIYNDISFFAGIAGTLTEIVGSSILGYKAIAPVKFNSNWDKVDSVKDLFDLENGTYAFIADIKEHRGFGYIQIDEDSNNFFTFQADNLDKNVYDGVSEVKEKKVTSYVRTRESTILGREKYMIIGKEHKNPTYLKSRKIKYYKNSNESIKKVFEDIKNEYIKEGRYNVFNKNCRQLSRKFIYAVQDLDKNPSI